MYSTISSVSQGNFEITIFLFLFKINKFSFYYSEKEIEEVLCKHSKNAPCSHFLSGRCHPRNPGRSSSGATDRSNGTGGLNNMGLLREACYSTTSSGTAPSSGRSSGVLRSVLNNKKRRLWIYPVEAATLSRSISAAD